MEPGDGLVFQIESNKRSVVVEFGKWLNKAKTNSPQLIPNGWVVVSEDASSLESRRKKIKNLQNRPRDHWNWVRKVKELVAVWGAVLLERESSTASIPW